MIVIWEFLVDYYGISYYEFYLWDFLIVIIMEFEFIVEDICYYG